VRCFDLESVFPKLFAAGYEKTSEKTGHPPKPGAYNCIAWAANDMKHWWWPDKDSYWPFKERQTTIPCFIKAFRLLGYRVCDNSRSEFAFEKVALYAINKIPKHMARQLKNGSWTSKCGGEEDITHFTLDAVESFGPYAYGAPELYMRRLIFISWIVKLFQLLIGKTKELFGENTT
jgi:hypothetical protein